MRLHRTVTFFLLAGLAAFLISAGLTTAEVDGPDKEARCPVCGMFVAKYPNWLARIDMDDGATLWFDGVKDMLVFFFNPEQYGGRKKGAIKGVVVRDYYTLDWLDGHQAFYVADSDVLGPMGKELIPFASRAAAENFLKDHNGAEILEFNAINDERVQRMRGEMRMKHGM